MQLADHLDDGLTDYTYTVLKGSFPNENAVYKLLYLRVTELQKKWDAGHYQNWSMVLNQLMVNEKFADRIKKYLTY